MRDAERLLKLLLRAVGVATLCATPAIFMPTAWLAGVHGWLGFGEFPDTPVVQYLARSVSAFYAMLGGLLLVAATDVRRHSMLITYLAAVALVFGIVMGIIDVVIALPFWWAAFIEFPLVPLGIIVLVLQRKIGPADVGKKEVEQ